MQFLQYYVKYVIIILTNFIYKKNGTLPKRRISMKKKNISLTLNALQQAPNLPKTSLIGAFILSIPGYIASAIKIIAKAMAGAIVLFALAHFVPELREEIPSFYQIVDFLLSGLEWISSKLVGFFPFL